MSNKKTLALTETEYKQAIELAREGFELDGSFIRPNERMATLCVVQANLGVRLSDILNLRMSSFVRDGGRWRLDIVEKKTGKQRTFTVPAEIHDFIQEYAYRKGIGQDCKLFEITDRQVERYLNKVFSKMGLPVENYGSHSFRKFFASSLYLNNNYNIELVRVLLQHASVATTQRYLTLGTKEVEDALAEHICLP